MEKERCLKCKHFSRTKKRCNKAMKYAKLVTDDECVLRIVKAYHNEVDTAWIDDEPVK